MKFISKHPNIKYVVNPITYVEVGGRPVMKPGKSVQFSNGELVTNDKEVIAHLKKHPDFGVTLFEDKEQTKDSSNDDQKDPGKEE